MNSLADPYPAAIRRQHPYGNLQPLPGVVDDRNRAISPLRLAKDLNGGPKERVERIEDLDLSVFRAQGIVGAGVIIPICIVSFQLAVWRLMAPDGSRRRHGSSCQSEFSVASSEASSRLRSSSSSFKASYSSMARFRN
jgi:hypothetical protein